MYCWLLLQISPSDCFCAPGTHIVCITPPAVTLSCVRVNIHSFRLYARDETSQTQIAVLNPPGPVDVMQRHATLI